jgi:hypothetical protein
MQQNLDFKHGAGQKGWRVGGSLEKKQKDCCEKAVSVGKDYILCNVYIEKEAITEHCLKVKSIWKKEWKIQECINWANKNLTTIFDVTDKYTFLHLARDM